MNLNVLLTQYYYQLQSKSFNYSVYLADCDMLDWGELWAGRSVLVATVLQYLTGFPPTIVPVLSGLLQPQYKIFNSTDTEKAAIIATFQVDFQCSGTQRLK